MFDLEIQVKISLRVSSSNRRRRIYLAKDKLFILPLTRRLNAPVFGQQGCAMWFFYRQYLARFDVLSSNRVSTNVTAFVSNFHRFATRRIQLIALVDLRRRSLKLVNFPSLRNLRRGLHQLVTLVYHSKHNSDVCFELLFLVQRQFRRVQRLQSASECQHSLVVPFQPEQTSGASFFDLVEQFLRVSHAQSFLRVCQAVIVLFQVVKRRRTIRQYNA